MPTYGITDAGYRIKPLEITKQEMIDDLPLEFGGAPPGSVIGFIIDVIAPQITSLDEQMAEVISMQDPRTSTGLFLDVVTTADRKGPLPSTVILTLTGTPGESVAKGFLAEKNTDIRFQTIEQGVTSLVQLSPGLGDFKAVDSSFTRNSGDFLEEGIGIGTRISVSSSVANSGNFTVEEVSQSKLKFEQSISDEPAISPILSFGRVSLSSICTLNGPIEALAQQVNTIVSTNNQEIHTVVNLEDVDLGSLAEGDILLRRRDALVLEKRASSIDASMRANLIDGIAEVQYARVFSNDNPDLKISAEGVKPGHTSVVVYPDGPDEYKRRIAEMINVHKNPGQPFQGDIGYEVTQKDGKPLHIYFNIATDVNVFMRLDIIKTAEYPIEGDALVLDQILDFAEANVGVGDTVSALDIKVFLKEDPVIPGIKYVDLYLDLIPIDIVTLDKDRDLEFTFDSIADIDSSRITINSVFV